MQTEWQTVLTVIWVYTVCSDQSVRKLRIIMVIETFLKHFSFVSLSSSAKVLSVKFVACSTDCLSGLCGCGSSNQIHLQVSLYSTHCSKVTLVKFVACSTDFLSGPCSSGSARPIKFTYRFDCITHFIMAGPGSSVGIQEVTGSILHSCNIFFLWRLVIKSFPQPFSPYP